TSSGCDKQRPSDSLWLDAAGFHYSGIGFRPTPGTVDPFRFSVQVAIWASEVRPMASSQARRGLAHVQPATDTHMRNLRGQQVSSSNPAQSGGSGEIVPAC
ncbi:MAG TPA: hypothetical protein VM537_06105, partial [Anaerolineae bacterium]|nr:hypothetical protein [Anaerolineae bacterium]